MYAGGAILALDAATRTGVCIGEPGGTPRLDTVDFRCGKGDDAALFGRAMVWMGRLVREEAAAGRPIRLVVIEGLVPQYDKTLQCGLWAIFTGIAAIKEIPVKVAAIQTWRAFVLGSGKLNKITAKARAINITTQLGWNPQGHDAAEAGCIWLWGCAQVAPKLTHRFEPLFLGRGAA